MPGFETIYRSLYDRFGFPLGKTHGLPSSILDRAAERLGVIIPTALRDYFTVAGNERRFNRSLQRFLHPSKWFTDKRHLIFLEENQSVCSWGVSLKSRAAKDPMISQGAHYEDEIEWHKEHSKCSIFISVILHYQAASGALGFCASGSAPDDAHEKLKKDWQYVGEVNQLWAFNRQNQVVCIMPGGGLPFMPAMILLAGGKTTRDLKAIRDSLGVKLS